MTLKNEELSEVFNVNENPSKIMNSDFYVNLIT